MKNFIEVIACENSNSLKYLHGKSSSGNTLISNVITCSVDNPDDLFKFSVENWCSDKPTIILYNDLASLLTPSQILTYLENILEIEDVDIFYLNKYCDSEFMNQKVRNVGTVSLVRVESPHGIDGLLVMPHCKQLISNNVTKDNGRNYDFSLNCYCSKLNAFGTNPSMLRHCGKEELKKVEFRDRKLKRAKLHEKNKSIFNVIYFTFVLIFFILLIYYFMKDIEEVDRYDSIKDKNTNYFPV